jgi:hypothetical protein
MRLEDVPEELRHLLDAQEPGTYYGGQRRHMVTQAETQELAALAGKVTSGGQTAADYERHRALVELLTTASVVVRWTTAGADGPRARRLLLAPPARGLPAETGCIQWGRNAGPLAHALLRDARPNERAPGRAVPSLVPELASLGEVWVFPFSRVLEVDARHRLRDAATRARILGLDANAIVAALDTDATVVA